MTTRVLRTSVALCVTLAAMLAAVASAHAATGTTTITYGPYNIPAGNGDPHSHDGAGMIANQLSLNVARPFSGQAGTITGMKANLVYANGSNANYHTNVMLHHMVLLASGSGHVDATCPAGFAGVPGSQYTERIFAAGNERTPVDFSGTNYGVKLGSSDQLHLVADLMNFATSPQTVYITIEYKWATGADGTARKGVKPVWLDVDGCGDSEYSAPFGLSDQTYDWSSPVTGALIGAAGHLHDHSLNLQVQNVSRGGDLCVSLSGFGETAEYVDTTGRKRISSMTSCYGSPPGSAAGWVSQGDTLRMHSRYYAGPEHAHATEGAMGIMLAYFDTTLTPPSTSGLPSVSISSPADNNVSTNNNPNLAFTTSGATSVTCKVNRAAPVACSSPVSVASLLGTPTVADGAYTIQVAASNATGARSTSVSFAVDTKAPVITIEAPAEGQVLTAPDVALVAHISDANPYTSLCSIDGGLASDCAPMHGHVERTYSGLTEGAHYITISAVDALGQSSTAVRNFTIDLPNQDTVAPVVTITSPTQNQTIRTSSVTVRFTATDNVGVVGTTCRLDSGPEVACTSPFTFTNVSRGTHTITVRATDAAGNVGVATRTFRRR